MNTVKFHVSRLQFHQVYNEIKQNGVKFYPIQRVFGKGYRFEIDDHPMVSFLLLKYDLNTLN